MIKKVLAGAGIAAAVLAAGAPMAAAAGDHNKEIENVGISKEIYGNTHTDGHLSPQIGLVQGTLNRPCFGVPVEADVQNIVALVNVGVQDILNDTQNQQCAQNSTAVKGDSALSHLFEEILSDNGAHAVEAN